MRRVRWAAGLLAAAAVGCGGEPGGTGAGGTNALSGKVTVKGVPLADTPLTVTGPGGATAGGMTNAAGAYLIPDPPAGKLEFQFVAPPGRPSAVPDKFTKPGNGTTFDYPGGKQTFDIDLK